MQRFAVPSAIDVQRGHAVSLVLSVWLLCCCCWFATVVVHGATLQCSISYGCIDNSFGAAKFNTVYGTTDGTLTYDTDTQAATATGADSVTGVNFVYNAATNTVALPPTR